MERTPIKDGSLIRLKLMEPGTELCRTFRIQRLLENGRGESFLCYEASHPMGGAGVLREFYPMDSKWSRSADQSLTDQCDNPEIQSQKDEILRTYDLLLSAKQSNPDLAACLPYWEIYLPETGPALYLFSVEPTCSTFEQICKLQGDRDLVSHLQTILSCLISLTQCIGLLHESGVLHCDLKPDNFGYLKRGDQLLSQKVTFFDLNSFIPDGAQPRYYTPEFFDPQTEVNGITRQIDLYSIGCCLNYALRSALCPEEDPYLHISDPVSVDEMMSSLPDCPDFAQRIRTILNRTLSFPRYSDSNELEDDLNEASRLLLRLSMSEQTERKRAEEKQKDKLRLHFYEHPLCSCAKPGQEKLSVLILGDGPSSGLLLDHVLKFGQTDVPIEVTVIGMEDPVGWMNDRPALSQFVSINDPKRMGESGRIIFEQIPFSSVHFGSCAEKLKTCLSRQAGFDRIYMSLKDSRRTRSILRLLRSFCWHEEIWTDTEIFNDPCNSDQSALLDQMGFRIHCLWERWKGFSQEELEKRYLQPYFHQASLNHAAAMKNQLHLLGLDLILEQEGPLRTAEEFIRLSQEMPANEWEMFRIQAAWMAHRRWAVEKLLMGYRPVDLSYATLGNTSSEIEKTHIRLIPIEPDLKGGQEMDNLDLLAQAFHREQEQTAKFLFDSKLLSLDRLESLRTMLSPYSELQKAFSAWEDCVRQTIEMNGEAWRDYLVLFERLRTQISRIQNPFSQIMLSELDGFSQKFKPVIQAAARRNWKADYLKFIDYIPYILTGIDLKN